jgi:hypothetical protein
MRTLFLASVALCTWAGNSALAGIEIQGIEIQGIEIQGTGLGIVRFPYGGMTKDGRKLQKVRIVRGGLVGKLGTRTLSGAGFKGVLLKGRVLTSTGKEIVVPFRIASVTALVTELPSVPSFVRGGTFFYRLQYRTPDGNIWADACQPGPKGASVAIPVAAIWDASGKRIESSTLFTFGCTSGAIGKCYVWGYRPWYESPTVPKLYRNVHQACTRMVRGDYCGDGMPHTKTGTKINIWDNLSPQIQTRATGTKMIFESGWAACGAICAARWRWPDLRAVCRDTSGCLYRRVTAAAGGPIVVENKCDSQAEAETRAREMGVPLHNFNDSMNRLVPTE